MQIRLTTEPTIPAQYPALILEDGTLIYDVWYWHTLLRRWFCMSCYHNPQMIAQGVVYFWPYDEPGFPALRKKMKKLEEAAGIRRL